jgi:hypothetical protein
MKRTLALILLSLSLLLTGADAKTKKKKSAPKKPCAANLGVCPPEGCSKDNHHDPKLNILKNRKSSNKPVQDRSLTEMMRMEKKVRDSGYKKGDPRGKLTDLGEGTQARVVGYLLAVKKEGGESCNCGLSKVDVETDNHLVLVNPKTITDFPLPPHADTDTLTGIFHQRETQSVTAEFTPRVRAEGHPNFTRKIQLEKLNKTPQGALWVRVTGQLMFDSEHFGQKTPIRATSWEIHPILKFEFCPQGKTCNKDTDANWVDLDDLP